MEKYIKAIAIVSILTIFSILLPNISNAYTGTISITADKTQVSPSDTVNIQIKLNNISDFGTGVLDMSGNIEYDSNFFSDEIDISRGASWQKTPAGKFVISLDTPVTTSGSTFATIQMKVKSTATGTSTIKFKNLVSSTGSSGEATSPDVELTFTIDNSSPGPSTDPGTTSPKPTDPGTTSPTPNIPGTNDDEGPSSSGGSSSDNNGGVVPQKTETTSTTKIPSTTSPISLPKAGTTIVVGVGLAIAVIIGVISYKKCKDYKDIR